MLAGIADIGQMLAFPTVTAGIIGVFFYNLEVTSYLFGDRRGILAYFPGDLLERHTVPETGFNDDSFAEG